MATVDYIAEIGIDEAERLYIKPATQHFDYIYRAAAEVGWDNKKHFLFSPKPREWSYFNWYQHIRAIANDEYGCQLKISSTTIWNNVPDDLRKQIEIIN